ncbi:MAG: hypothetical protein ACK6EB_03965, partial [Planctomyces sp.]
RYALDFEPGTNADAKYKNDLVKAMLGNGGEVFISGVNEHGQAVEVRRQLATDPQVFLVGQLTRLRPRDVFPNVLYFGQKDLGSRHEGFEAEFFKMLTGASTTDDREAFDRFLNTCLRGTGFRTASRELLVSGLRNGLEIFQKRETLQELLGSSADVEKLRTVLFDNLAEFLTFRVPDRRKITFNGTPIDQLSLGKRAMAILTLLTSLNRYSMMLLDQPEDDLDNETIFRNVVAPLLERKQHCQFVIATHNANIPVLGDAEQIHACREVENGKYEHQSGSLDSPVTSQT